MQNLDAELGARLRHSLGADETMVEKFIDRAGDLAISLVVAAIILFVSFWAAKWLASIVQRLIGRVNDGEAADPTLQSFGGSLVRYTVIVVGLIAALQQLGMQTASILAVFGAASLAIGLALQGALSNVAAGVMILLFRPYRVGDQIEVAGRTGRVRDLDLFVTELATADNLKVVVPNGKVFGDVIVNHSFHDKRRVDVTFKMDVKHDVRPVLAALEARANADPRVLQDPAPSVEVTGMAEAWVEAAVRAWVRRDDYGAVKSDLMLAARVLAEAPSAELPAPAPSKVKAAAPKRKRPRLPLLKR